MQLAASYNMDISMGMSKLLLLQGDSGEGERDSYGDLPPDARPFFGASADGILKLEGSVYGLRAAPSGVVSKGGRIS